MKIQFSRHAKRRMRLYDIPASDIADVLTHKNLPEGPNEIIQEVQGSLYPLKIVVAVESDKVTVVTCYPLKKGRKP